MLVFFAQSEIRLVVERHNFHPEAKIATEIPITQKYLERGQYNNSSRISLSHIPAKLLS